MKPNLFLLLPFIGIASIISLNAQVLAGITGDLDYTALTINQSMDNNPIDNYTVFEDSVDLDGDGNYDLLFSSTLANVPDFGGSVIGAQPMNLHTEIMYDSLNLTNLQMGTPIVTDSSWVNSYGWSIAYDFYGFAGWTYGGNWYPSAEGYLGFRIIEGSNIRYGWVHLFASVSQESFTLLVYGYAIEPIINSVSSQDHASICVYPNPIKGGILNIDTGNIEVQSIRLFSAAGVLRKESHTLIANQFDLSNMEAGIYFLQILAKSGETYAETIYIE